MAGLFPWLNLEMSQSVDLEDMNESDVPDDPGVYILCGKVDYPYPWSEENGKSNVFYIGQTKNLRKRLRDHRRYIDEIKNGSPRHEYYYPIYEYACYHQAKVCWRTLDSAQVAKEVEESLLEDFAKYYGARPVANNQSSWPRN